MYFLRIFVLINQLRQSMNIRHIVLLFFFVACCVTGAVADSFDNVPMRLLGRDDGLAGATVSNIITDHRGQAWIATSSGVNTYNGSRMVNVPVPRSESGDNYVFDICEGSDNCIYICTGDGVFRLAPYTDSFVRIVPGISKAETLLFSGGALYIGNRDGLHVCRDGKLKSIRVGASPVALENGVRDIDNGSDGKIWFVSKYALNAYSPSTGKVETFNLSAQMPKAAAFSHLAVCGDKIYLGTKNNGLYVYYIATRRLEGVKGVGSIINSLRLTAAGELAVATDGAGAYLISTADDSIIRSYKATANGRLRLPSNAVYCYYRDAGGIDWFGFYRYGMAHSYKSEALFSTYGFGGFSSEGLNVRSFFLRGKVCVLGTSDGIVIADEAKRIVRHIPTEQLGGSHFIAAINYFNGYYYIASYDGGLCRIDERTFAVSEITQEPLLSTITTVSLVVSPDNRLWVGSSEGLFIIDGNDRIMRYTENNSRVIGSTISGIDFDRNGNAWLCGPGGISVYVSALHRFENTFPDGFFNKKSPNEIMSGHGGKLYFNTSTGVYYTDIGMNDFGRLQLPEFMSDERSYSFLDDGRGFYWFSLEDGLYCLDYNMDNLMRFGCGESLNCSHISSRIETDREGRIWIGTSNGLVFTDRKRLSEWRKQTSSKVLVYDMLLDGEPVDFGEESRINDKRSISLPWNIYTAPVSFRFLLDDFSRPSGRLYEYRIDGESKWQVIREGEPLRLTGLLLGSHTLDVRLAGVPGTQRTYNISVHPSALAFFELALVIMAVVLYVLWTRYRKYTQTLLSERSDIERALIEVETEQQNAEMTAGAEKYRGVKVDEQECREIVGRMRNYMEKTRIYTNPDMKMSDLSGYLHLSVSKLSQVFSLYLHENYYEFVNRYRLEEFKRLVSEGEAGKYTIIALSEKCGFKKSNFFSTFRKVEGMTPAEYMKKHNIIMQK